MEPLVLQEILGITHPGAASDWLSLYDLSEGASQVDQSPAVTVIVAGFDPEQRRAASSLVVLSSDLTRAEWVRLTARLMDI